MKIKSYLNEIKYRLSFLLITIIGNSIILYYYKEQIIFLLGEYQNNFFPYFIATNVTEIFIVYIKLSIYLSIYFSFPIFLLQSWFFFIPALYQYEYKLFRFFILFSLMFFSFCTLTTMNFLLPSCLKFFSSFELNSTQNIVGIHMELSINDFLNFFLEILFLLTFLFHFLLILIFIMKLFPFHFFIKFRKIAYFIFFVLATFFSPPDIFSQSLIGLSLVLFYEGFLITTILNYEYKRVNNGS